ncbi:hypothetical protein LBMAG18_10500 [Alphaproteobacteria bacterium]|nr:hypothetical protein LBMAG18_10500 [Alphaproteobacteria bacterium]
MNNSVNPIKKPEYPEYKYSNFKKIIEILQQMENHTANLRKSIVNEIKKEFTNNNPRSR